MHKDKLNEIKKLLGTTVLDIGRASDLLWIHFGEKINVKNYKGVDVEKGEFAFHFQCPWRFIYNCNIILASKDIYIHKKDIDESEFDFSLIGMSIFDEKKEEVMDILIKKKIVQISYDEIGNINISYEDNLSFEAFSDSSLKIEYWRFINNKTKEHIVCFENED